MLGSVFLQHLVVAGPEVVLPPDDVEAGELVDLLVGPESEVDLVPALLSDGEGLPPAGHTGAVRGEETEARLPDVLLHYGTDSIGGSHSHPGQLLGQWGVVGLTGLKDPEVGSGVREEGGPERMSAVRHHYRLLWYY